MIRVHHNPKCSKSRAALAIIEAAGYTPEVNLYLKTGWTQVQLQNLFAKAGIAPREALRPKPDPALKLTAPSTTDAEILDAMVAYPGLVERPIVETPKGVAICRPPECVLDLLDRWPDGPYSLPNGQMIIDKNGTRIP